jgi:hypothetical protein
MLRFQLDRPIMVRRWRQEWEQHGRDFGNCHCGRGIGTMRKHRPYESHASGKCGVCTYRRFMARAVRRRERRTAYVMIAQELRGALDALGAADERWR